MLLISKVAQRIFELGHIKKVQYYAKYKELHIVMYVMYMEHLTRSLGVIACEFPDDLYLSRN